MSPILSLGVLPGSSGIRPEDYESRLISRQISNLEFPATPNLVEPEDPSTGAAAIASIADALGLLGRGLNPAMPVPDASGELLRRSEIEADRQNRRLLLEHQIETNRVEQKERALERRLSRSDVRSAESRGVAREDARVAAAQAREDQLRTEQRKLEESRREEDRVDSLRLSVAEAGGDPTGLTDDELFSELGRLRSQSLSTMDPRAAENRTIHNGSAHELFRLYIRGGGKGESPSLAERVKKETWNDILRDFEIDAAPLTFADPLLLEELKAKLYREYVRLTPPEEPKKKSPLSKLLERMPSAGAGVHGFRLPSG